MNKFHTAIFLDDERHPKDVTWIELPNLEYKIVRNWDQFIDLILNFGVPEFISFDHDLGENSFSGYECAKWLVNYCFDKNLDFPAYTVHSMNPIGKENIKKLLENYARFRQTS